MAFCKFCQGGLNDDSTICPNCGKDNAVDLEQTQVLGEEAAEDTEEEFDYIDDGTLLETDEGVFVVDPLDTDAAAAAEPSQEETAEEKAAPLKKSATGKIIAAIVAVVAIAVIAFFALKPGTADFAAEGTIDGRETYDVQNTQLIPGSDYATGIVAQIGEHQLTNAEFQIYYWMQFYNLVNTYGDYLSMLGLDTSQPFSEQDSGAPVDEEAAAASTDGEYATLTWEQYFIQMALECYEEYTALADAARTEGMTLTEEYEEVIAGLPESLQSQAESAGMATAEEFIQDSFGSGTTVADYVSYMETYLLAAVYAEHCYASVECTEADVEAYYDENADSYIASGIEKKDLYPVDVRHILIQPEMDTDSDEDGVNDTYSDAAMAAAEETANELYAQWQEDPTEENFADLAVQNSADPGSAENGGLYGAVTPGQMVAEFNDWCFDEARQPGDTGIVQTSYGFHIMYFVTEGTDLYWYTTAETDYKDVIYGEMLAAVIEPVTAAVNYSNIYVNNVRDMA